MSLFTCFMTFYPRWFSTLFELLHEDFKDKVTHELLLIYFRAVETDTSNLLHLGNVFDGGNGDTYLAEARQNAAAFFRPREAAQIGRSSAIFPTTY